MSTMTPKEILKNYWGYDQFRPVQEEIIESILDKKDTLAILPTGAGKSLCFQVPALLLEGTCLVISPLIALMHDQIEKLNRLSIPARALTSGISQQEVEEIMNACEEKKLKLLYVSPERLNSRRFLERLPDFPISLLAVDEAHCISQWGYDFRPAYLKIADIKSYLNDIPIVALTASATPKVKTDIIQKLQLRNPSVFLASFARENLSYQAIEAKDKINTLVRLLKENKGSSIVYCKTRRTTKEIAELLNQFQLRSDFYHAGLTREQRTEKQKNWINNTIDCIVCTNAFGMGIDKADVRLVVHLDIPDCLENYYQEAGRAGRDQKAAKAVLLYRKQDLEELSELPSIKFPSISTIRKVYKALGNYFQVPAGTGKDMKYDFDLVQFLASFKLNLNEVLYSLETLKQEEIIDYQDQVYSPSSVVFIADRNTLERAEKDFPTLEPLMKILLRTYGGIFDAPVKISEKQIAWSLREDISNIKTDLQTLHRLKIIEYDPSKENSQIIFLCDRIIAEELHIDYAFYEARKKEYIYRIDKIIEYTQSNACRSLLLSKYFGEQKTSACGNCDNCLKSNSKEIDNNTVLEAAKKIKYELARKSLKLEELKQLIPVEENTLKNGIRLLQNEGQIIVAIDGKFALK